MEATLYFAAGGTKKIEPADGKEFSLEELQGFVKGNIEIIHLPSGKVLVCNEDGKLQGMQYNGMATEVWMLEFPLDQYPENNIDFVVGNCLITSPEYLGE